MTIERAPSSWAARAAESPAAPAPITATPQSAVLVLVPVLVLVLVLALALVLVLVPGFQVLAEEKLVYLQDSFQLH